MLNFMAIVYLMLNSDFSPPPPPTKKTQKRLVVLVLNLTTVCLKVVITGLHSKINEFTD